MQRSTKRHNQEQTASMNKQPKFSDEQEFSIMVAALTNVITGTIHTSASATISLPCTSMSYSIEPPLFRLPEETEACQFCKINGCLGCNYFGTAVGDNNNKTLKINLQKGMNTEEEEFWDELMNSDNEIQDYFKAESSNSANGYIAHSF
ncbi:hypothetical protein H5410_052268 [Solanum commersonii]|uniref:Uncharacterized protein n=1 Tax=Solanum commersonii TaxID=4109 RepID=A0A9J5X0C9_SOLCO|nr:hypothetical protein H5410_052268 [Solanum commersonii]